MVLPNFLAALTARTYLGRPSPQFLFQYTSPSPPPPSLSNNGSNSSLPASALRRVSQRSKMAYLLLYSPSLFSLQHHRSSPQLTHGCHFLSPLYSPSSRLTLFRPPCPPSLPWLPTKVGPSTSRLSPKRITSVWRKSSTSARILLRYSREMAFRLFIRAVGIGETISCVKASVSLQYSDHEAF